MSGAVSVNARALHRRQTGVERYTRAVCARLAGKIQRVRGPAGGGFRGHLWEQLILPQQMPRGSVLWSPANTGPVRVRKQVLTLHDISPLDWPGGFTAAFRVWYRVLTPILVRRVRMVITDSLFSKRRVISRFGLNPDRVLVISPGVDHDHFFPRTDQEIDLVRKRYDLPGDFFVFVGSLQARKNVAGLLRGWELAGFAENGPTLLLAGTGSPTFKPGLPGRLPAGVRALGYVQEEDLPALYSGAKASLLLSWYEGFGLTLLEAMACGSPVIASDRTALPEVVGEAGVLIDPGRHDQIADALRGVLDRPEKQVQRVNVGLRRAADYTWEKTAASVWDVLERVAGFEDA